MRLSASALKHVTHTGSSFDDFLDEGGIKDEVEASAVEKVQAWKSESATPVDKVARGA
jgi:hypothetical protein